MFLFGIVSTAATVQQFSPPGAVWSDSLFAYGALALLVGLVIWQESKASDPPIQS